MLIRVDAPKQSFTNVQAFTNKDDCMLSMQKRCIFNVQHKNNLSQLHLPLLQYLINFESLSSVHHHKFVNIQCVDEAEINESHRVQLFAGKR